MFKVFEIELLPNPKQAEQLAQHAGSRRWLWNHLLGMNIDKYNSEQKFIFRHEMQRMLPGLKQEHPWLKDINSQSLQEVCIDLNNAISAKISKKKAAGFPKFKKKHDAVQSFKVPQNFKICNAYIQLPKIGRIKYNKQRNFEGKIKKIDVKCENERWFALIVCELPDVARINDVVESEIIGIDLGISDFAILSTGDKIENPRVHKKLAKKQARAQRKLSRKQKLSKNRAKQRRQVAKIHRRISNKRKDFQWKTAHSIAKMSPVIAMETLNVKGMIKNHKLAKHIADAAWFSFKMKLTHQLAKRGGFIVEIDRFAPSSKTCSSCGTIKTDLTLSDRKWTCSSCGSHHDRDINAAANIRQFGINELHRLGTCRIYACGDNSAGLHENANETMSLKQETELPLGNPTCSSDKW